MGKTKEHRSSPAPYFKEARPSQPTGLAMSHEGVDLTADTIRAEEAAGNGTWRRSTILIMSIIRLRYLAHLCSAHLTAWT